MYPLMASPTQADSRNKQLARQKIIHEAFCLRLIVKRRPDTPAECAAMQARLEIEKKSWEWLTGVEALGHQPYGLHNFATHPKEQRETFHMREQGQRMILVNHVGEQWASANWIHTYLLAADMVSMGSFLAWLRRYRENIRQKRSEDGLVWLFNLADFIVWRTRSVTSTLVPKSSLRREEV